MSYRDRYVVRDPRGFTLLELLVVIAIIAVLATLVAPNVLRHVADARVATARSQLEVLALALAQYQIDTGQLPSTEQGLSALRAKPLLPGGDGRTIQDWRGPYLTRPVPADPWGRPYVYLAPGIANPASYDLYTLGRDAALGGDGENADVTSWGGAVGETLTPETVR